jgi:hypothetical protein
MKTFGILFLLALFFLHPFSYSQIPHTLSYQGILADSAGTPKPDGSYSFTFRLYTVPSGGVAQWSETKSAQVKRGLFSTILGSVTPIPDSVKFDRQYWLGVQVGSDPELAPRMQLSSVGSSMNSLRADVAETVPDSALGEGKIASGQVVKSINNLHDNLTMRGANGAAVTTNGDTITVTASGGSGGSISAIQNTDNALSITNPAGPTTTVNLHSPFTVNGNVGIGTTTPGYMLNVGNWTTANGSTGSGQGIIIAEGNEAFVGWGDRSQQSANRNKRWGWFASGGKSYLWDNNSATSRITADGATGNIGIGTTTPTSKLEIAGQDGLAITGYQPFLTLRDGNAGNARGALQNVGGGLNLFADSYLTGADPTAFLRLDNNGNVGIGTATPTTAKLEARTTAGIGVWGVSTVGYGVVGNSTSSYGVTAYSENSDGLVAQTNHPDHAALIANNLTGTPVAYLGTKYDAIEAHSGGGSSTSGAVSAIHGIATNALTDFAGLFEGDVWATFNLTVGWSLNVSGDKNFKIDHPLDPANSTLAHACIESNERLLLYSGTVVTGVNGEATIKLPSYFEALNINYRYQLTIIGEEFAQSRVSKEISGNEFSIKTDKPNIKVCWQVVGDRNDAYSKAHPYVVEELKKPDERGKYLRPDLYGQPETMRIGYRPLPAHQQVDRVNLPVPSEKAKQ